MTTTEMIEISCIFVPWQTDHRHCVKALQIPSSLQRHYLTGLKLGWKEKQVSGDFQKSLIYFSVDQTDHILKNLKSPIFIHSGFLNQPCLLYNISLQNNELKKYNSNQDQLFTQKHQTEQLVPPMGQTWTWAKRMDPSLMAEIQDQHFSCEQWG